MQSVVALLTVLFGVAVANPMIIMSDSDQGQKNREISSSEYLRRIFENSPMYYFSNSIDVKANDDIVGKLQSLGLQEAAKIAEQVDLRQIIRDSEQTSVTLCMPSDKAVQKWKRELPDRLKPDQETLRRLVKAWIAPGRIESSQISNNQKVQSLNGAKLRFNIYNDAKKIVTVNGARIIDADRQTSCGIIQVVDKVIYPLPVGNVVETLRDVQSFSTIVDLLTRAGLAQDLETVDPITVLVPTNAAFQALPAGALDDLKRDNTKLRNVLKYHVISEARYSASLSPGQRIRALQGDEISVSRENDQIFLNKQSGQAAQGSRVIQADIPTTNGVVHVIDRVIIPPQKHFVLV